MFNVLMFFLNHQCQVEKAVKLLRQKVRFQQKETVKSNAHTH